MVITYAGGYCFKLSSGDTTIAINPPSSKSAHKVSKFGSDIVLISANHPDWDGEETATHGSKDPFVVRGPGAYEIGDVVVTAYASEGALVKGLPADRQETSGYGNTIYAVEFDGMKVLVLGALSSAKLPQEARSDIDGVDIVFVPVGGETLAPKDAHDLVVSLEPKLIIPYSVGKSDELKAFLKSEGATDVKAVDKVTLRAKEVSMMSGDIALLK